MKPKSEDRNKRFNETVAYLDKHCNVLLAYLSTLFPNEIGFNALFNKLQTLNEIPSFSKGTLIKHLRHLLKKELIVVKKEKGSPLKIKPMKYRVSPYFVEIAHDLFEYKALDPKDLLPEMNNEEIKPLTIFLLDLVVGNVSEFLRKSFEYSEKAAAYKRHVIYYHFENIAKAYRLRVLKKDEIEKALRAIDEFNEFWDKMKKEKWGNLIATMYAYQKG